MPNPVIWWEIGGRNADKSHSFYKELFDWRIDTESMKGYGVVDTGGEGGIGGGIMQSPGEGPYLTFYVKVDDVQAYLDRAVKLGGEAIVAPEEVPGVGTTAFMKDPDGNIVGLFKPVPRE
jgi:predicted enzyme related to lactoylglutathione lyase